MTQAKLCGASLYSGADGKGTKMNLRKQPVNRNASHGNPSKEDSKGNFKSGPNGLNKKHLSGVGATRRSWCLYGSYLPLAYRFLLAFLFPGRPPLSPSSSLPRPSPPPYGPARIATA